MELPSEKHSPSPVTGASGRSRKPARPVEPAPPSPDDAELELDDGLFSQDVIALPPRAAAEPPAATASGSGLNTPPAKEVESRPGRKVLLERKVKGQPPGFKRFVTRPQTAIAAHAAISQKRAESPASLDHVARDNMQFGKIHQRATPDYRPNRLFRVLDGIYKNTPLRWLDFVERTGARFLTVGIILVIAGGFIAWRYFATLAERQAAVATDTTVKVITLSHAERIERGTHAVREYLAAQTVEAKLPFVLDPENAAPKMRRFYDQLRGEDPKVLPGWEVGAPVAGDHGAWLPFTFKDSTGRTIKVVLGESDAGCQLDWENYTAYGELPWTEFLRTRPTAPQALRVRLRLADKYAGAFNREAWQAYEIEHRSGGPQMLGYAARAGRTAQALAGLVKSDLWQSAHLYLHFEAAPSAENTVLISDPIRSRWQDEATTWTGP